MAKYSQTFDIRHTNSKIKMHGVDIPSAGVPYLNVMRWGSSKILDMIV